MKQVLKTICEVAFLVCFACLPVCAQDVQFLPEVDAYLKLNPSWRAYLQAKDDRDGGDPTQFTIGPSIQYYSKPLLRLKKITSFDLDDAKSRALVLETGYRYITAPGAPPENRMETIAGNRKLICSGCGRKFTEAHDYYQREVRDLPWRKYQTTVIISGLEGPIRVLSHFRCPFQYLSAPQHFL
jgi:hypothetical protein